MIGTGQQISSRLTGRIRTVGSVKTLLGESALLIQRSIDLVCGHLNKSRNFPLTTGFQQNLDALHIGSNKSRTVQNAAIYMGLGGKIDDRINPLSDAVGNVLAGGDIAFEEDIPRVSGNIDQVLELEGHERGAFEAIKPIDSVASPIF